MTNDTNTTSSASAGLNSTGTGFMTHSPTMSIPRVLISLALTVAVSLIVVFFADWGHLKAALPSFQAQPLWLAVMVVAYTAAFGLRAVAWHALVAGRISIYRLFVAIQAALLANHILPFKLGELVRPLVAQRAGLPLSQAAATTAVARMLDLVALLVIAAAIGSLVSLSSDGNLWMQGLALPAAVVLAAGALLLAMRWHRVEGWLPGPLQRRFEEFQSQLQQVSPARIAHAALWTLPSWALEAFVLIVVAKALGVELSIPAAIAITAFTILFQMFHITPGGIGVYEGVMAGALYAHGLPFQEGLALAALTHGLKFAYSYTIALAFTLTAVRYLPELNPLNKFRGTSDGAKGASRFEMVAARLWNVFNEGKPFTPVFVVGILALLSLPHITDGGYWAKAGIALLALAPLFLLFYRFDFPLKLRLTLWLALGAFFAVFHFVDLTAVALVLGLYIGFTVFFWGTVYYRLRIGTPWTNFTRFWRLVLENPDPTSGNFLEQVPKVLLMTLAFQMMVEQPGLGTVIRLELFILGLGIVTLLVHQWFFTWPPAPSLAPTRVLSGSQRRRCRRFIAIVIDGCREDRLKEAYTPCIDRLRQEGADYLNTSTVYPARTVTCFSSMLTGAPPKLHGMRSNFVPNLGVKCESIFDALRAAGMTGKLVGIAHLVDAFGDRDVETVTAVTHNDEIDHALVSRARAVMERDDPDCLVLQLLSVDQTGHARGSYNSEYLSKIEESDRIIDEFLNWCSDSGYLEDATVLVTADHGQGIGIGGHGHMSPTEVYVPCIMWGAGVEQRGKFDEPRSVMDVAPTIACFLGTNPPSQSVGRVLGVSNAVESAQPLAVIIPAYNEAENLPDTLAAMPTRELPDMRIIVVDDGSTDGTGEIARRHGADIVVRHENNRGLGAALRTGLETARQLDARAAVYIDADGEYPPSQIPDLLAPIDAGEADYVLGSRYLGSTERQPVIRLIANMVFTGLLCLAAGRRITDGQTGFRAFSRDALECAEIIHDYNYAQVLTLDLLKKGMRMREVPISYSYRTKGKSFINMKYLWRVPVGMIRQMLST